MNASKILKAQLFKTEWNKLTNAKELAKKNNHIILEKFATTKWTETRKI